jgi:hypothetical protein
MYKELLCLLLGMVFAVFMTSAASADGDLASYEPKSPDEAEIIKVLMVHQDDFNNRDLDGWVSCFHENAKYPDARGGLMPVEDLPGFCRTEWARDYKFTCGIPNIKIDGDKAVVRYTYHWTSNTITGESKMTLNLTRENDKWLIIKGKRMQGRVY